VIKISPTTKEIFLGIYEYLEFGQMANNISKDEDDENANMNYSNRISKSN